MVGVVIGQIGVAIDPGIKDIFCALFIYAAGFQGGPRFFHALNLRSRNRLASAFVMCFTGLLCVLAAAWMFGPDRGMAAGLAAGGLAQYAFPGTAGDAIGKLGLSADLTKVMPTNVAVFYAVCYIFGSPGPIIMVTSFLPFVMRWDIRKEAVELAKSLAGRTELEAGQYEAVNAVGMANAWLGAEIDAPAGFSVVEESREAILTNRVLNGREIGEIHDHVTVETRHGVFLTAVKRMGRDLPLLNRLALKTGDELHFAGSTADLDRVQSKIGYRISAAAATDFIFFGIGSGPQALSAVEHYGLTLFFFGVGVTLTPQVITFCFSWFVLRIRNPIAALACVAGGRSANPAFAALLAKADDATPVISFTITYAAANVFLTLLGPCHRRHHDQECRSLTLSTEQ